MKNTHTHTKERRLYFPITCVASCGVMGACASRWGRRTKRRSRCSAP